MSVARALPRRRFGPDEAQHHVGGAVLDPAGGEGGGERGRHDAGGPECGGERPAGAGVRGDHIGGAQPGADAFREPRDVPGQVGHDGGEGRRAMDGDEAIGVVLDDGQAAAPGHRRDGDAAGLRHGQRGRVLQRGVEVERFRAVAGAGIGQRVRVDAIRIRGQPDELDPKLRGDRPGAGIGDGFREHGLAGFGEDAEDPQQGAVRAGRHEQPLLRGDQAAAAEPAGGGVLGLGRAAEALVAEQGDQAAADLLVPGPHLFDQGRSFFRLGRQVHREIDGGGEVLRRRGAGGQADEGAAADLRFDQSAFLRFHIAAGDGGEVDGEALGQVALRRQAVVHREASGPDVVGDGVCDGEVAWFGAAAEVRGPVIHRRSIVLLSGAGAKGDSRWWIDCILLRSAAPACEAD